VKLLLARGANVNAKVQAEQELRSPLSMAKKHRHAAVVAVLLAAGAKE